MENMYNYDTRQMSKMNRKWNGVQACQIVEIDDMRGITYRLPWGNGTSWIRPADFEIGGYKVGQWIDMILITVSYEGHKQLLSAQFIGRTPEVFIPKK